MLRQIAMVLLLAAISVPSGAEDFHEIYEAKCQRCHGHAGPFAREALTLENGVLRDRKGRDLATFLARHQGGLSEERIDLFLKVFTRQIESGGVFRARCKICHDRAYELARLDLILSDGRLIGRYSGRDIATFLLNHGRLSPDEAAEMTDALTEIRKGAR